MLATIAILGIIVCQANANCGAWAPDGAAQVVAVSETSELLYAERPLALPRAPADVPLEWEWSFSPDGNTLAVRRMTRRAMHIENPGNILPKPNADWSGVIDLHTFAVTPRPLAPLLGWRGATPLTTALLAAPTETALAVAPNGDAVVIYDGRDGNVAVVLRELPSGRARVLYAQQAPLRSSYADRGGVVRAGFSRDGSLLATLTLESSDAAFWHATVQITSLDGTQQVFRDEFQLEKNGPVPELSWAPAGPERLLWWSRVKQNTTLQVTARDPVTGEFKSVRYLTSLYNKLLYQFPVLWSPAATQLAWVDPTRRIVTLTLNGGGNRALGPLPADARSWSWAAPPVMRVH